MGQVEALLGEYPSLPSLLSTRRLQQDFENIASIKDSRLNAAFALIILRLEVSPPVGHAHSGGCE